jgi:hypothetical protein
MNFDHGEYQATDAHSVAQFTHLSLTSNILAVSSGNPILSSLATQNGQNNKKNLSRQITYGYLLWFVELPTRDGGRCYPHLPIYCFNASHSSQRLLQSPVGFARMARGRPPSFLVTRKGVNLFKFWNVLMVLLVDIYSSDTYSLQSTAIRFIHTLTWPVVVLFLMPGTLLVNWS